MKSDKALRGSTGILIGAAIAVMALARGVWQTRLLLGILALWGIWMGAAMLRHHMRRNRQRGNRQRPARRLSRKKGSPAVSPPPEADNETTETILLRHVNHRVSTYLRSVYSDARWEWCADNPEALAVSGGTGRIRLLGVPDFDHADIRIDRQANISCSMLKIVPLGGTDTGETPTGSIPPGRQPTDPQVWYELNGRMVLEALVADLNSRGHSLLMLHEDGDVCIDEGNGDVPVGHLENFPGKVLWPRLVQVFERNGLAAEVTAWGIRISW